MQDFTPPKEQVPKKPLELISQVDGTTAGRNSGERVIVMPPKGKVPYRNLNSQVKGQRRVDESFKLPFYVLFCVQKKGSAVFQVLSWELADKIFNV